MFFKNWSSEQFVKLIEKYIEWSSLNIAVLVYSKGSFKKKFWMSGGEKNLRKNIEAKGFKMIHNERGGER